MLAVTRLNEIKDLIRQHKSVMVADLAARFGVTEETIRRDLKRLEEEGLVNRVYGGAYSTSGVQNDVNITLRETVMVEEKADIARRCLPYIDNGDSIFLDCSTTTLYLANMLTRYALTVITNSLKVAESLAPYNDIRLVMIGGRLHRTSLSFLGQTSCDELSRYYVDKAFVSCRSVSLKNGITDSNEEQSAIRRIAIDLSEEAFLLADHTKLDVTSYSKIAPLQAISALVTNQPLNAEWRSALAQMHIRALDGAGE